MSPQNESVISPIRMRDITYLNVWYHIFECVISRIRIGDITLSFWICDITHSNTWYHIFEWWISHIRMGDITYSNVSQKCISLLEFIIKSLYVLLAVTDNNMHVVWDPQLYSVSQIRHDMHVFIEIWYHLSGLNTQTLAVLSLISFNNYSNKTIQAGSITVGL